MTLVLIIVMLLVSSFLGYARKPNALAYCAPGSMSQGSLTEGEGSVRLASLYFYFRSAPSYIESNSYLCYKTISLNEEVNCTEPFHLVSVP